jgi:uncharacterized protein (DUF608 family)
VNEQANVLPGEIWPSNQFYDIWIWRGTSVYVAGIWLATLKAGISASEIAGEREFKIECEKIFEKGIKSFDEKLWRGDFYRTWSNPSVNESSEICLGNQLMADWCGAVAGTGPILDEQKALTALGSILLL